MKLDKFLKARGTKPSDLRYRYASYPVEVWRAVYESVQVEIWRDGVEFRLRVQCGRHLGCVLGSSNPSALRITGRNVRKIHGLWSC